MTDQVGLLQHASFSTANTEYGYCTDDNARALAFVTLAREQLIGERGLERLFGVYFQFLQAAFDYETATFRNLRSYSSEWIDESGSGDAPGRALWALGSIVGTPTNWPRRIAAKVLFEQALPLMSRLRDLRPISCVVLGLCAYLRREQSEAVVEMLGVLSARLFHGLEVEQRQDWIWPEPILTYENARMAQAMIAAGRTLEDISLLHQGLSSLRWLIQVQTDDGLFAPVGNRGWYARGGVLARFDQQPIEADATIAACLEAYSADGESLWLTKAQMAFDWFLGDNAIGQPVAVLETGGCRDGLSATSVNENQGAESTLAWLTSQLNLQALTALSRRRGNPVSAL